MTDVIFRTYETRTETKKISNEVSKPKTNRSSKSNLPTRGHKKRGKLFTLEECIMPLSATHCEVEQ